MFSTEFYPLCITSRDMLTPDVMRLRLQRPDGTMLPAFRAGAHVQIQINEQYRRAYSLCSDPAQRGHYEVAVKLELDGRGGSQILHQMAQPGVELAVSTPSNLFALASDAAHHLLVGGGVGLTPLIAMAYELSARQQPFTFVVAASSRGAWPFAAQLNTSGWPVDVVQSPREQLDLPTRLAALPASTHVYCCGPEGLMARVRDQCALLPAVQWHEEAFSGSEVRVESGFQLYLSESDLMLEVSAGSSIIAALRQAGVQVDTACEQGICGSCVVPWRDGEPVHGDQCLDEEDRCQYMAVCCGGCRSPRLTLAL
ncbi:PDR/VanB family oxidoreductase [Halopseudomonas pelagia]|uniref:PDR/VanB family oxidoreductase n=1 Tax=Halopseudomonas pelagia TaxID=553151 RepID=UPI0030DBCD89|tara:strand:+ start:451 stop:1386 length:936 start_codon:yes stop_codon:yes gene_type:complete